jgi:radical SAM superfamily enzyme YgiQ (UPF0313 family)
VRVCLASAPAHGFLGDLPSERDVQRELTEDAALGVLTLAAVLERAGFACELIHLTEHLFRAIREFPEEDAVASSANEIAQLDFEVLGLSTICSSYPAVLRIASEIKRRRPQCKIVLGGPQASVTDVATLQAFPAVDIVVRGEADETLPQLLDALDGGKCLALIPGLTYRTNGQISRTPNSSPILNLDSLPLPAFHLLAGIGEARRLPLEIGRGCPFSCTFCSTNDFFRRRFRLKSSEVVLAQMTDVQDRYPNIKAFDLTHDMFTVDRRRVIDFCRVLKNSGRSFKWNCSARTDCVDEELIDIMADAGCTGIFFGIETASPRMQRIIEKELDIDEARRAIRWTVSRHITTTVATIIGFPNETEEDLAATLDFVFGAATQRDVEPQISLLAPLAKTPIHDEFRDRLEFDGASSDFCHQGFPLTDAEVELIRGNVDVFQNFYSVPTPLPRKFLREGALFFSWQLLRCRWLALALAKQTGGPLICFRHWLAFRHGSERIYEYYSSQEFHGDFVRFAASFENRPPELDILATVQSHLAELGSLGCVRVADAGAITLDAIPHIASNARVFTAPGDPEEAISALSSGVPLADGNESAVTLAARRLGRETEVFRPSDSLLQLLSLCDGHRTASAIAGLLARKFGDPISGYDGITGWLATMEYLRRDGFLEIRSPVVRQRRAGEASRRRARTTLPSTRDNDRYSPLPI